MYLKLTAKQLEYSSRSILMNWPSLGTTYIYISNDMEHIQQTFIFAGLFISIHEYT